MQWRRTDAVGGLATAQSDRTGTRCLRLGDQVPAFAKADEPYLQCSCAVGRKGEERDRYARLGSPATLRLGRRRCLLVRQKHMLGGRLVPQGKLKLMLYLVVAPMRRLGRGGVDGNGVVVG